MKNIIGHVLCAMVLGAPVNAQASTYDVFGNWSGGQLLNVNFDFSITNDFTGDIGLTSSGLLINTLTSTGVGGDPFIPSFTAINYQYGATIDTLAIFAGDPGLSVTQDFYIEINDFTTANPSLDNLSRDGIAHPFLGYQTSYVSGAVTVSQQGVTAVPEVTTTGSLAAIASLLAMMAFLWERRRLQST
ncbi:hypothetical protein C1J05_06125 [Sulfitobacter sp. JL08]|uniref:hypothetical protein n=1 Tax=Sulfitobacter sp. JL08 TaxID=2070369 RepID=UPI000E0AA5BB|nr:hypothetical protein [Sulfitobacter sp. JL08]AXI54122.1 hypothetical protein C1J05_06125 [Sulfitobacter sp. JL08]